MANSNFKATITSSVFMSIANNKSLLITFKNLIFLGSSCIYPKNSPQPMKEEHLLTGKLEETNDAYAIAKIAGIKMCESYNFQYKTNYKCLMPANMFGANDNYDLKSSHFFPALIKKINNAKINKKKSITLWGNGQAMRELLYVGDFANACVFFMGKKIKESFINIGSGKEKKISDYANFIMKKLGASLQIKYDLSKPNGMKRKILNLSIAKKYGWSAKTPLDTAFNLAYQSFLISLKVKNKNR